MPKAYPKINSKKEIIEPAEKNFEQAEPIEKGTATIEIEPKPKTAPEKESQEIKQAQKTVEQPAVSASTAVTPEHQVKSQTLEEIENILQEDLEDIYFQMSPEQQSEFKQVGEQTANQIEGLLGQVKVKVMEILKLIKKWLKIIPGINKFFLEQEAKIKADKILDLKEKQPQNQDQNQDQNQNKI